eukprot:2509293-Rhodomonas_salina.2
MSSLSSRPDPPAIADPRGLWQVAARAAASDRRGQGGGVRGLRDELRRGLRVRAWGGVARRAGLLLRGRARHRRRPPPPPPRRPRVCPPPLLSSPLLSSFPPFSTRQGMSRTTELWRSVR